MMGECLSLKIVKLEAVMLICNGKILTMSHDNVVYNHGYLWIKDGKITDVGDMSEVGKLRNRNKERILDVSGELLGRILLQRVRLKSQILVLKRVECCIKQGYLLRLLRIIQWR